MSAVTVVTQHAPIVKKDIRTIHLAYTALREKWQFTFERLRVDMPD